ncbi:hypothetical protein [Aneurinibacillus aneurinilyticus]|uniref:hypothetical protein n=1 Tax=Aneurinibacillus aneurinilyticus TaxID=1391 RepID=UPI003526B6B3
MTDQQLNEGMQRSLATITECCDKLSVYALHSSDLPAIHEAKEFAKTMRKAAISKRDKVVAKKIIDMANAIESVIKRPTLRNARKQAMRVADGLEKLDSILFIRR